LVCFDYFIQSWCFFNYLKINLRKTLINKQDLMNYKNTSFSSRISHVQTTWCTTNARIVHLLCKNNLRLNRSCKLSNYWFTISDSVIREVARAVLAYVMHDSCTSYASCSSHISLRFTKFANWKVSVTHYYNICNR